MTLFLLSLWSVAFSEVMRSSIRPARFFHNDVYKVVLPETHRFPMEKYRMVREGLQREFLGDPRVEFEVSPLATAEELKSTHCSKYVDRYLCGQMSELEIRRVGFPWSISGVQRSTSSVGGTVAAMRAVCSGEAAWAGHIAGGTHHAFFDYGEGFCVFSDIAIAANLALKEFPSVRKILIIDLDVHQGNGNAMLFKDDDRVFTFSMHCKENYFSKKQESNLDIELPAGCTDDEYLSTLNTWLPSIFYSLSPNLVFYQAGIDILESDRLGRLKLTRNGSKARNQRVYELIKNSNSKFVITMGGGYPKDLNVDSQSFKDIINAHIDVYKDSVHFLSF